MKPTNPTKPGSASPEKTRKKTALFAGNDKGGVGKTATTAAVADAMRTLGYKLRLADGDASNQTFQRIFPGETEKVQFRNESDLDAFLASITEGDEDLTILDLPGESGLVLTEYFHSAKFDIFDQLGIRIVVGLTVNGGNDSIVGARTWAATFHAHAEMIGLANGQLTPPDTKFSLAAVPGGRAVEPHIKDRLIYVPRFSDTMVQHYAKFKAPPSAFLPGGRAYHALKLDIFSSLAWRTHYNAVLAAVAPHAEWLTGKPIPNPVEPTIVTPQDEKDQRAEFLRAFDAEADKGSLQ